MHIRDFFNFGNSSDVMIPNRETIKRIFNAVTSPVFENMDLSNEKNTYIWSSNYNTEGIKIIIQFKYRRQNAMLLVGTNFDFIPMISQGKISKQTDQLHLYEAMLTTVGSENRISLRNKKIFKQTLELFLQENTKRIEKQIQQSLSIQENIDIALQQLQDPTELYKIRDPQPKYVLPFLYAKLGNKEKALELMNDYLAKTENVPFDILDYLEEM